MPLAVILKDEDEIMKGSSQNWQFFGGEEEVQVAFQGQTEIQAR